MANDPNNVQEPPPVGPNFQNPNPNLRPMEELLPAPTDGVGDTIVVPPILANQFELKISLLNLVTAIAFHGFKNDDPHSHIPRFTKITQTVKLNNVSSDVVKLLLFPFSLKGAARTCLEKEPPNSITTWNDFVSKFVNHFFPPSKTTNLRIEITRFQQRFGETFSEAWDRFKNLLNKCLHHVFSPLHQIDTFYNSLNQSEQDSFNSAANSNFLTKNTQEALTIIENKSKVQSSRNKPQVLSASGSSTQDAAITAFTKQVEALVSSMNRPVNSIQNGCETCGGPHAYYECQATGGYTQEDVYATLGTYNSGGQMQKALQERPQVGPSVPPPPLSSSKEVERDPESTTNQVLTESTTRVLTPVVQPSPASTSSELPPAPASSCVIPDFLQIFKKLYFNISFASLAHMPKYAKMVKDLLINKEKLLELANTPLNENCSVKLSLLELTPTRITLELATRTITYPAGIAEDVFIQVGKFIFPNDFVVVDYDVDPCVPLILGRPFLRTTHVLVDVHGEELTLRVGDEKLVFNVESTSKYPRNYGDESIHKINILDIACEDHFHEVLNVQKLINLMSGSLTPSSDHVVASLSPSLTPLGRGISLPSLTHFRVETNIDDRIFDPEGDIRLIKEFLNNEIPNDLPHPLPVFEINETEKIKTLIYNPLDLELKDLPPHLEYAFLEGTSKLPVIIAKT
ncbi:reverse transcriptase domain-containing protein [Tanacetum coccineum]